MNCRCRCAVLILILIAAAGALPMSAANATLPPGTKLQVRITDRLSSDTAKPGDTFHGTIAQPVVVNHKILFDKGTEVKGEVVQASRSGRLSSPGQLRLILTSISGGWFRSYPLSVQPLVISGASHTKSNVGKIGGATAAGAVIGAVAGGGKGAAIGAGVGAGAGTALAAATGKHEAVVSSEALLTWISIDSRDSRPAAANTTSTVAGNSNRDARSYHDPNEDHYSQHRDHRDRDEDEDDDRGGDRWRGDHRGSYLFSARDQAILRSCIADNYSNLPPGLAKRDRLPPGLERQLQRNGTLPPGLRKRVRPLPDACEVQLSRVPRNCERVMIGGRILLLDGEQTIIDILELGERD
jgi:hypothetical protein